MDADPEIVSIINAAIIVDIATGMIGIANPETITVPEKTAVNTVPLRETGMTDLLAEITETDPDIPKENRIMVKGGPPETITVTTATGPLAEITATDPEVATITTIVVPETRVMTEETMNIGVTEIKKKTGPKSPFLPRLPRYSTRDWIVK